MPIVIASLYYNGQLYIFKGVEELLRQNLKGNLVLVLLICLLRVFVDFLSLIHLIIIKCNNLVPMRYYLDIVMISNMGNKK